MRYEPDVGLIGQAALQGHKAAGNKAAEAYLQRSRQQRRQQEHEGNMLVARQMIQMHQAREQQRMQRENEDYRYSAKQQRLVAETEDAWDRINQELAAGNISEHDAKEFRKQVMGQRMGIKPGYRPQREDKIDKATQAQIDLKREEIQARYGADQAKKVEKQEQLAQKAQLKERADFKREEKETSKLADTMRKHMAQAQDAYASYVGKAVSAKDKAAPVKGDGMDKKDKPAGMVVDPFTGDVVKHGQFSIMNRDEFMDAYKKRHNLDAIAGQVQARTEAIINQQHPDMDSPMGPEQYVGGEEQAPQAGMDFSPENLQRLDPALSTFMQDMGMMGGGQRSGSKVDPVPGRSQLSSRKDLARMQGHMYQMAQQGDAPPTLDQYLQAPGATKSGYKTYVDRFHLFKQHGGFASLAGDKTGDAAQKAIEKGIKHVLFLKGEEEKDAASGLYGPDNAGFATRQLMDLMRKHPLVTRELLQGDQ